MKYRKESIIVEAEQWFPGKRVEGVQLIDSGSLIPYIDALDGPITVMSGDWIIRESKGKVYSCKPEIFMQQYKLIEQEP